MVREPPNVRRDCYNKFQDYLKMPLSRPPRILHRLTFPLKPCHRPGITHLQQQRPHLLQNFGVISIQPVSLRRRQQRSLNKLCLYRDLGVSFTQSLSGTHHRDMLQLHELLAAKVHPRSAHLDHIDVLYSDTELAVCVIARLVRDDHAGDEGDIVVLQPLANALRPLVYVQEGANTVGGAMSECQQGEGRGRPAR